MMKIFKKKTFVFDWGLSTSWIRKFELKDLVSEAGGIESKVITKTTDYLVNIDVDLHSYKTKKAIKYNVPVIHPSFIRESIDAGLILDTSCFTIDKVSIMDDEGKSRKRGIYWMEKLKDTETVYKLDEVPVLDQLVKFCVLEKFGQFCLLELHGPDLTLDGDKYGVISHIIDTRKDNGHTECRYLFSLSDALQVYSELFEEFTSPCKGFQSWSYLRPSSSIHSSKFKKMITKSEPKTESLSILSGLWTETLQYIDKQISLDHVTTEEVDKALGILLLMREELSKGNDSNVIGTLSKAFHKSLPFHKALLLDNNETVTEGFNFCQLIKKTISLLDLKYKDVQPGHIYHCLQLKPRMVDFESTLWTKIATEVLQKFGPQSVIKGIYRLKDECRVRDTPDFQFYPTDSVDVLAVLASGQLLEQSFKTSRPLFIFVKEVISTEPDEVLHDEGSGTFVQNGSQQSLSYLVELSLFEEDKYGVNETEFETSALQGWPLCIPDCCQTVGCFTSSQLNKTDISVIKPDTGQRQIGLNSILDNSIYVPLVSVAVDAMVLDMLAKVTLEQSFMNNSNSSIDVQYVFPIDENCVVTGFEAIIKDQHIVGEIREKDSAHTIHNEAVSEGHSAVLLEQYKEDPSLLNMKLGYIGPKDVVVVRVMYVTELQVIDEKICFHLPALQTECNDLFNTWNNIEECETVEECKVQVSVEMPFDIISLECPSHRIDIERSQTKAFVQLKKNQRIAYGFKLLVEISQIHEPRMWVERHPDYQDHQACMVSFYREFPKTETTEIVFLLDISMSMSGEPFQTAKLVLTEALSNLTTKTKFNIVSFGNGICELFPCSYKATAATIGMAKTHLMALKTDGITTNFDRVLNFVNRTTMKEMNTSVFIITDGHVSYPYVSMATISDCCEHLRIFTLGVGKDVNNHCLKTLAVEGRGDSEHFHPDKQYLWTEKITKLMKNAENSVLSSINLQWQQINENVPSLEQSPAIVPSLFSSKRCVVYGFVQNCTLAFLNGSLNDEDVSVVVYTPDLCVTEGTILHILTAHALIKDWQFGILHKDHITHQALKFLRSDRILELSKEFSILSPLTSFVAVDKRSNKCLNSVTQEGKLKQGIVTTQTATPSTAPTGLVGSNNQQSGFKFGSSNTQSTVPPTTKAGLFGTNNQQSGFKFGSSNTQSTVPLTTKAGLFGSNNQQSGFKFSSSNTQSTVPPITEAGLFGTNNQQSGFKFSSSNTQSTVPPITEAGLFGTNNQQSGFKFSSSNTQSTVPLTAKAGLFGSNNQQSGFKFSSSNTQSTVPPITEAGLFGTNNQQSGFKFSSSNTQSTVPLTAKAGLFGSNNQQSGFKFSSSNTQSTVPPITEAGLFGTNNQQSGFKFSSSNTQSTVPPITEAGLFGTNNQQSGFKFSSSNTQSTVPLTAKAGLFGSNNQQSGFKFSSSNTQSTVPPITEAGLFGTNNQQSGFKFSSSNTQSTVPPITEAGLFGSNNQQSGFKFGSINPQTDAPPITQPGLFGSSNEQGGFAVGSTNPQTDAPSTAQSGLFGSSNEQSEFAVGSTNPQTDAPLTAQPGLFGSSNEQGGFAVGSTNPQTAAPPTTQSGLFGSSNQQSGFKFSSSNTQSTVPLTTKAGLFGSNNQQSGFKFSSSNTQSTVPPITEAGLFGTNNQQSGFKFSSSNTQSTVPPITEAGLFGTNNQQSGFKFSSSNTQSTVPLTAKAGLFGSNNQQSGFKFSSSNTQSTVPPITEAGLFGTNNQQSGFKFSSSNTQSTVPPITEAGLFGTNNQQSGFKFSSSNTQSTVPLTAKAGLFGSNNQQSGFKFSSSNTQSTVPPITEAGLFGTNNQQSGFKFSSSNTQSTVPPITEAGLFGTNNQQSGFKFSSSNTQSTVPPITEAGLFGTNNQQSGFKFSSSNTQSTVPPITEAGLFGSNNQQSGFKFGSINPQTDAPPITQPGLFGSSNEQGGFAVGSTNPQTDAPSTAQSGLFGSSNEQSEFAVGSTNPQTDAPLTAQPGLFGSSNEQGGFAVGSTNPQTAAPPTTQSGLFGSSNEQGGFAFGSTNPQTDAPLIAQPGLFGSRNEKGGFAFGSTNPQTDAPSTAQLGLFGPSNEQGGFAFGSTNTQTDASSIAQSRLFGPSNEQGGFAFGSTNTQTDAPSTAGLYGHSSHNSNAQHSCFGSNVHPSGFGSNVQHSGLGTNVKHSGFGSNVQHSGFGLNVKHSGFGSNVQHSGFGSNVQHSGFGSNVQHSGFGSNVQPSGFGSNVQPSGYGSNVVPSGFSSNIQPHPSGSNVNSSSFASKAQYPGFDSNVQSSGFGSNFQLHGSNFPSNCGSQIQSGGFNSKVHSGFGSKTQPSVSGSKSQPNILNSHVQHSRFASRVQPGDSCLFPAYSSHQKATSNETVVLRPSKLDSPMQEKKQDFGKPVSGSSEILSKAKKLRGQLECIANRNQQAVTKTLQHRMEEKWNVMELMEFLKEVKTVLNAASSLPGVNEELVELTLAAERAEYFIRRKQEIDDKGKQLESMKEFVNHPWSLRDSSRLLEVLDDIEEVNYNLAWPPTHDKHSEGSYTEKTVCFPVRCGTPRLCRENLTELLILQEKTGEWLFSKKLDALLGIDADLCRQLLVKVGLNSFGKIISERVLALISTMAVLLNVLEVMTSYRFPMSRSEFIQTVTMDTIVKEIQISLHGHERGQEFTECIDLANKFVRKVDHDYILLYSQLELGESWPEAVAHLLGFIA